MNNDVFENLFEGFNEFDDEVILDNVFDSLSEGLDEFDADSRLPIAANTDTTVA